MTDAPPPLPPPANPKLRRMANALRALAMDAVEQAKSGHPGMPMGMADIATVLFTQFLRFDPQAPDWPDRDRFVLSNGHGSMLLYGLLHLLGYPDMTLDELKRFRQLGSRTAGHPERGLATGIEVTTGPLGQGIANSVGMALAERLLATQFGDEIVDHRTYVFCGDGCLMEGISHEAIGLAGHLRLNKLIVLWDDNSITIDGPTSLSVSDDQLARFRAHGWAAERIDGIDHDAIAAAIRRAQLSDKPNLIACRTIIAFGAPTKAGTAAAHGSPLGAEEIKGAKARLGWEFGPFIVPDDVRAQWREAGARGAGVRQAWERAARRRRARPAGRVPAPPERRTAGRFRRPYRQAVRRFPSEERAAGDTPGLGRRARCAGPGGARADRRLGRPDPVEQHPRQGREGGPARRFHRPLYPLRHSRARHGGGDERDRRAWRPHPLWRDIPHLHRLRPAVDPLVGADRSSASSM